MRSYESKVVIVVGWKLSACCTEEKNWMSLSIMAFLIAEDRSGLAALETDSVV
jgi:hypothetical protein